METKRHFKLYKSGKQWVTAAITTVAVSTGILMGGVANADTATPTDDQSITTTTNSSTANDEKPEQPLKTTDLVKQDGQQENGSIEKVAPKANNTDLQTSNYDHNNNGSYGAFDSVTVNDN